jgi:hypothetical protein
VVNAWQSGHSFRCVGGLSNRRITNVLSGHFGHVEQKCQRSPSLSEQYSIGAHEHEGTDSTSEGGKLYNAPKLYRFRSICFISNDQAVPSDSLLPSIMSSVPYIRYLCGRYVESARSSNSSIVRFLFWGALSLRFFKSSKYVKNPYLSSCVNFSIATARIRQHLCVYHWLSAPNNVSAVCDRICFDSLRRLFNPTAA